MPGTAYWTQNISATAPLIQLRAPPLAASMDAMERQEIDLLLKKAKTEWEAATQKYHDRVHSLEVAWEFASENGEAAHQAASHPQPVAPTRPAANRGRPADADGPMPLTREACRTLLSGYTIGDVQKYLAAHHPTASIARKQISSALSKLIKSGEIKISKDRKGNAAARYQTIIGGGAPKGETQNKQTSPPIGGAVTGEK